MRETRDGRGRWWRALTAVLVGLGLLGAPGFAQPAAAQPGCQFLLGFAALHDQIPAIVGNCLEDQHFDPQTGDALQRTTNGLLAWRKADNWTAFTDGATTWLSGPFGLQSRPNGDRFPWEADLAQPTPPPPPVEVPALSPPAPAPTAQPAAATSGPIRRNPGELALALSDVGKEITQVAQNNGTGNRANWYEVRFERSEELVDSKLGPVKVYSKVYVSDDVEAARAIYNTEVERQKKMPESQDRWEGLFAPQGVTQLFEQQNSLSACNDDCNTERFNRLHQRTVARQANVVYVLYFWGRDDQANPDQLNEWLRVLRGRLGG